MNEALVFYINYLNSIKKYKKDYIENKIKKAIYWDFYNIDYHTESNINKKNYTNHSKKLEENLFLAINED